jgi:outer membrane protein assembly factor BamB
VIAFSPSVEDSLYVGTIESRRPEGQGANGALYSIDPEDGSVNWQVSESGVVTTPAVTESTVIFGTVNGSLIAVEKESGDEVWRLSTRTSEVSSPAYKDGMLYYGVASDKLYAVDAETGKQEWTFEGSGDMTVSPSVSGEKVYAGSRSGFIYAVNASTGDGVWWTELESGISNIALTSVGDTVYAGTNIGVYAVSRNSTEATRYTEDGNGMESGNSVELPPPGEEDPLVEPPTEYGDESDNETEPNASGSSKSLREEGKEDDEGVPASYLYPLVIGVIVMVAIALYGWKKGLY